MTSTLRSASSLAIAFGLAACGSGGDAPTPPVVPDTPAVNTAPRVTSALTASVAENTTDTAYTITATDAEGDTLTYAVSGTDSALFTVDSATGAVSFETPPDFELPADANGDNAYEIRVEVADATLNAVQDVSITVTDQPDETDQRYVDRVFAGVDNQANIAFAPNLFMDVFTPTGDTLDRRPTVLIASGGGFAVQSRDSVAPIAQDFALRGYTAVTMDYRVLFRLADNADELAVAGARATHDMYGAVRFLRADAAGSNRFGIDPDRLIVSGVSAGGVMAISAAALDPDDVVPNMAIADYFDANGGIYGTVGGNTEQSSVVQGAVPISGAISDLSLIDANTPPLFAAHEEFDFVVPCDTGPEGAAFTGLIGSGSCDFIPAADAAGVATGFFLVEGSNSHVGYTAAQFEAIATGAAQLMFEEVVRPQ